MRAFLLLLLCSAGALAQLMTWPGANYAFPEYSDVTGEQTKAHTWNKSLSYCSACRWFSYATSTTTSTKFYPCAAWRGPTKVYNGAVVRDENDDKEYGSNEAGKLTLPSFGCWATTSGNKADPTSYMAQLLEWPQDSLCCNWGGEGLTYGAQSPITTAYWSDGFSKCAMRTDPPDAAHQAELVRYQEIVVATEIYNEDDECGVQAAWVYGSQASFFGMGGHIGTNLILTPKGAATTLDMDNQLNALYGSSMTTRVNFHLLRANTAYDHLTIAYWPYDRYLIPPTQTVYADISARCTADFVRTTKGAANIAAVGFDPRPALDGASPCRNGGNLTMTGLCRCAWPYAGPLCERTLPTNYNPLQTNCSQYNPCSGHGVCTSKQATVGGVSIKYAQCACTPSWLGSSLALSDDVDAYTGEVDFYSHEYGFCNAVYADPSLNENPLAAGSFNIYSGVGATTWTTSLYSTPAFYLLINQCAVWIGPDAPTNWMTQGRAKAGAPTKYALVPTLPWTCFSNLTAQAGVRYAGPECVVAGNFSNDHADCTADPATYTHVRCSCHDNYYLPEGCFTPICPVPAANTTLGPCGVVAGQGICPGVQTFNATAGYLGSCVCSAGWGGIDCNTRLCVTNLHPDVNNNYAWAPNALPCSGSDHGTCVNASGTSYCDCEHDWKGAACDVPRCTPLDSGGNECSNVTAQHRFQGSRDRNVCNNQTSRLCECWRSVCEEGNTDWEEFYTQSTSLPCPNDGSFCSSQCETGPYNLGGGVFDYCRCFVETQDIFHVNRFTGGVYEVAEPASLYFATYGKLCENRYVDACNTSASGICAGHGLCYSDSGLQSGTAPTCHCNTNLNWIAPKCEGTTCAAHPRWPNDDGCNKQGSVAVTGTCTGDNAQCFCKNDINPMYTRNPATGRCDISAAGCTVLTPGTSVYTVCSNNGVCANGACVCYPTYSGQYCATRVNCPIGCSHAGSRCLTAQTPVCVCHSNYNGGNCTTNLCVQSGGQQGKTPDDCDCPSTAVQTFTTTFNANFCRKKCPVDPVTGHECGYGIDNNGLELCANLTLSANSSQPAVCVCNGRSVSDAVHGTGTLRLTKNTATGLCEPVCLNGGLDVNGDGTICSCDTRKQWTGHRCNVDRCSGNGKWDVTAQRCNCTSRLFNSADCSTTICDAHGTYSGGQYCSCDGPLWVLNTTTGGCSPACQHGTVTNATSGACTCAAVASGTICDQTLCASSKGGIPAPDYGSCVCTLPQWGGTYCSTSQCRNGGVANALPASGCVCTNNYYNGTLCEQDVCATYHGVNNGAVGSAAGCTCNPGWGQSFISDTRQLRLSVCNVNLCRDGFVPVVCNSTTDPPCKFLGLGYTCKCGPAATFASAAQGCVFKSCGHGTPVHDPYQISRCVCDAGWSGDSCSTPICPQGSSSVTNGTCVCTGNYELAEDGLSCVAINYVCTNGIYTSSDNSCECNPGYGHTINVFNATTNTALVPQHTPSCVRSCRALGTASVDSNGECVCRQNYYGVLCDGFVSPANLNAVVGSSSSISDAAIAGIVVGGFAGVVGIALSIWYFLRQKRLPATAARIGKRRRRRDHNADGDHTH